MKGKKVFPCTLFIVWANRNEPVAATVPPSTEYLSHGPPSELSLNLKGLVWRHKGILKIFLAYMRNNSPDYWERQRALKKLHSLLFHWSLCFPSSMQGDSHSHKNVGQDRMQDRRTLLTLRLGKNDTRATTVPTEESPPVLQLITWEPLGKSATTCSRGAKIIPREMWPTAGQNWEPQSSKSCSSLPPSLPPSLRSLPGSGSGQSRELPTWRAAKPGGPAAPPLSGGDVSSLPPVSF